ncbi:hypothetical protein, partial [Nocardia vinacea]|uniref:hypothetical protein n=1 Tax=Nocardia vinacea TaxID=96468 RepID=UPI000594A3D3
LRPVQLDQLTTAADGGDRLHTLHWTPTPIPAQLREVEFVEWNNLEHESADDPVPPVVVLDCRDGENNTVGEIDTDVLV